MISVKRDRGRWSWTGPGGAWNGFYGMASHALQDAWTWCGSGPALIYIGGHP